MSRLTQGPIVDGDAINAASLNDRFTQFTQSGALNQFNTRDGAFDLPQFETGASRFLVPDFASATIGYDDWKHSASNTYTGQTTGASPFITQNAAPANTVLSLGAAGFTLQPSTHILRVYWDLSVKPYWNGSKPWTGGASFFTFPQTSPTGTAAHKPDGQSGDEFVQENDQLNTLEVKLREILKQTEGTSTTRLP